MRAVKHSSDMDDATSLNIVTYFGEDIDMKAILIRNDATYIRVVLNAVSIKGLLWLRRKAQCSKVTVPTSSRTAANIHLTILSQRECVTLLLPTKSRIIPRHSVSTMQHCWENSYSESGNT